jgi:hypothetical protein
LHVPGSLTGSGYLLFIWNSTAVYIAYLNNDKKFGRQKSEYEYLA